MNALPKFYEVFIPMLETLKDGKLIHRNELKVKVKDKYFPHMPKELLEIKTKSGDQLLSNRIGWAIAYLKQAKMVLQPARAMIQISDKGLDVLTKGSLSLKELRQDPDFQAHEGLKKKTINELTANEEASPQDLIDKGVQEIEDSVKAELLEKLKSIDPYFFEQIVNNLFEKMGYGDAETTVKSGDKGVDGIINQDVLGLEKIYIQAKRFSDHSVREPEIRNFVGAMGRDTQKGIFVTTSSFDISAINKARDASQTIILIDGKKLTDLMYKFGVGIQVANTYEIKEIDEDYFS